MTWATISGAGTTTATKFHGDVMNKINNMLGGTDVSDTVTINSAVTWTFENGAFKLRNPADTFSYTITPAAIAADRALTLPLATGADTILARDTAATPINKTYDADNNTFSNFAIGSEVLTTLTQTEEISIPAGAFTSSTTNGAEITSRETTTNKNNYTYAAFDTTTSESVWFTWTPPANWNAGTLRYKLKWTNTAGEDTETIDFDLAAVAVADDDPIDVAVGTAQSVTDTWIAQGDEHVTSYSSALTVAGSPVAGERIQFKLSRDVASDDLTGDADIIEIILEYTVNDIGTT